MTAVERALKESAMHDLTSALAALANDEYQLASYKARMAAKRAAMLQTLKYGQKAKT